MGWRRFLLPVLALVVVAALVLGLVTGVIGSLGRAGLEAIGGRLWLNTPFSVVSLAPDGTDVQTEHSAGGADGYICGIVRRGGKLVCSLSASMRNAGYELRTVRLCGKQPRPA